MSSCICNGSAFDTMLIAFPNRIEADQDLGLGILYACAEPVSGCFAQRSVICVLPPVCLLHPAPRFPLKDGHRVWFMLGLGAVIRFTM